VSDSVSFHCPSCKVRLRAKLNLVGRSSACPGCRVAVVVPVQAPAEEGPVMVADEGYPGSAGGQRRRWD
jgi:hypothetical protein